MNKIPHPQPKWIPPLKEISGGIKNKGKKAGIFLWNNKGKILEKGFDLGLKIVGIFK